MSSTLVPLVLGSSRMGMIIQVQSHQCQTEERITSLSLLPTVMLIQPRQHWLIIFFSSRKLLLLSCMSLLPAHSSL